MSRSPLTFDIQYCHVYSLAQIEKMAALVIFSSVGSTCRYPANHCPVSIRNPINRGNESDQTRIIIICDRIIATLNLLAFALPARSPLALATCAAAVAD